MSTQALTGGPARQKDADEVVGNLTEKVLPDVEHVQTYVWRRHLAGAAGRSPARPGDDGGDHPDGVGFADIVSVTHPRRSRQLDRRRAESPGSSGFERYRRRDRLRARRAHHQDHRRRGPFRRRRPGGRAGSALAADRGAEREGDLFPQVRVGVATATGLSPARRRLRPGGEHRGPSHQGRPSRARYGRPGRARRSRRGRGRWLGPGQVGGAVRRPQQLRLRRLPRTSVKGYSRLGAWAVRRPG